MTLTGTAEQPDELVNDGEDAMEENVRTVSR